MEKGRNVKDSLIATLTTIQNCDNKAGSLLTAVGIVFGFSMFSVDELKAKSGATLISIYVLGSLYLIVFLVTIISLIMIVFPRRRNREEKNRKIEYQLYSEDLFFHLKKGDIESFIDKNMDNSAVLDQIKNCSRIAHVKENLLRASVFSIILFALLLAGLVVCMFF